MLLAVEMTDGGFDRWERLFIPLTDPNLFVNANSVKTKDFAPLGGTVLNAINRNIDISGRIAHLLQRSGPLAIGWLVIPMHIYPVDRMLRRRPFPHISKKILKTVPPTVADNNATRSIGRISWIIGIIATKLHFGPSLVFRRSCQAMCSGIIVAAQQICRRLFGQAPATERTASDIGGSGNGFVPAVALAFPHSVSGSWHFCALNNEQSTKPLSFDLSHTFSPLSQDALANWDYEIKGKVLQ